MKYLRIDNERRQQLPRIRGGIASELTKETVIVTESLSDLAQLSPQPISHHLLLADADLLRLRVEPLAIPQEARDDVKMEVK